MEYFAADVNETVLNSTIIKPLKMATDEMEHKVTSGSTQWENNVRVSGLWLQCWSKQESKEECLAHTAEQQHSVRFLWADSVTA